MPEMILAYDLGTGGNKATLYNAEGQLLASDFVPYETEYPQPGWHEQRPEAWWDSVVQSTRRLLANSEVEPQDIRVLAISGHSLGCVPLDDAGHLLRESTPIWSDSRPVAEATRFFEKIDPLHWYRTTGNGFTPWHYTAFKILWYRYHEPEMYRKISKVIGTKDYINYKLTGRIATDYSYASGSGVYDLLKWDYSDQLLEAADLPRELLPEILPSTEILGTLTAEAAETLGLPQKVLVACGGVDNSCMALGARNLAKGQAYASLGSSMWIAVSDENPLLNDTIKPYVFTHVIPGMFTSAIGIFSGGSSFQWTRDQLCSGLVEQAAKEGKHPYDLMTALAKQSPVGANQLLFNPSLAGGCSLDASPNIRGAFCGLQLGHTLADIIRATMEGIAMNLRVILDSLRDLGSVSDEMIVVGGSSKSKFWRQIFADVWETKIVKTVVGQEAGSLGAAAVAAVGAGLWNDFSKINQIHKIEDISSPIEEHSKRYAQLLPIFRQIAHDQSQIGDLLASIE